MWRFKKSDIDFGTGLITLVYIDENGSNHNLVTDAQSRSVEWLIATDNIDLEEAQFHVDGCADIYFNRIAD